MALTDWLNALEGRYLADLRVPEVTRALRALSSAYVHRRQRVAAGATLDSAGKRAAFALYYGPLHYVITDHIVRTLGACRRSPHTILDIGCGTGTAGAAWAVAAGGSSQVLGIDRHPWAVREARWTYRLLGIQGHARQSDASRLPHVPDGGAIIAAYVLNELPGEIRAQVLRQMGEAAARGARVLVIEPIARGVAPWWDVAAAAARAAGGRADEWRFRAELPDSVLKFGRAAGLRPGELTARSLFFPAA